MGAQHTTEGENGKIRSVDHSAKTSSGAMGSLTQPELAGTQPELTSPAECCTIPENFYKGIGTSLQDVFCSASQEALLAGMQC